MHACRHQSGDVRHIHHQVSTHLVGNLTEPLEINGSGVSAGSGDDHLRLALLRDTQDFIVIQHTIVVDSVRNHVKIGSGEVRGASVCQVSAVGQILSHDGIARLQHGELYCHIGLRAGMGLYVHILAAEQLLRPLTCQLLHLVHAFAAAVIAFSRISFCIFIGQGASHGGHDRFGYPVFRCNQLNMAVLTGHLCLDGCRYFLVHCLHFIQ